MYYTVVGTNRVGASSASSAANATSVDLAALTVGNVYLRGGTQDGKPSGQPAFWGFLNDTGGSIISTHVDAYGNVYVTGTWSFKIFFIPKRDGTYFGQSMTANCFYTIAGNGIDGFTGDGGAATSARISRTKGITTDTSGNVYIADSIYHRIRFIPVAGGTYFGQAMTANYIYTIAGTGTGGFNNDNVVATSSQLNSPYGVRVDVAGNVYVADYTNNRIRFIAKTTGTYFGQAMTANYIYTIAGTGTGGFTSDNVAATSSQVNTPTDVTVDAGGNVYVADYANHRIRFIAKTAGIYFGQSMTANSIYTIAGTGTGGFNNDNVSATTARIHYPFGVTVDAQGNMVIGDSGNQRVRFMPRVGGTYFGQAMTANYIFTIGGTGSAGYTGDRGPATAAKINTPAGVSTDSGGNVYCVDSNSQRVRMIAKVTGTHFGQSMTTGYIYSIAGSGPGFYMGANALVSNVVATSVQMFQPWGVAVDASGNILYADSNNNAVRFIPKASGTYFGQSMTANFIYTIAGNGTSGYVADNVAATATMIQGPFGVSLDADGNVYFADSSNRIRFVPRSAGTYFGQSMTANYIYTIAGNGTGGIWRMMWRHRRGSTFHGGCASTPTGMCISRTGVTIESDLFLKSMEPILGSR